MKRYHYVLCGQYILLSRPWAYNFFCTHSLLPCLCVRQYMYPYLSIHKSTWLRPMHAYKFICMDLAHSRPYACPYLLCIGFYPCLPKFVTGTTMRSIITVRIVFWHEGFHTNYSTNSTHYHILLPFLTVCSVCFLQNPKSSFIDQKSSFFEPPSNGNICKEILHVLEST